MATHHHPALDASIDLKALNLNQVFAQTPPTPPYELDEHILDVKLQFSRLQQSMTAASLLDDQGHWSGLNENEALRLELYDMALKLQLMLTRPFDTIQAVAQAHHCEAALRYAVNNNLAQHVPTSGSISYSELATKASVDSNQCRRLLRLLASNQVFAEIFPDRVAHTPASLQLLDPDICAWVAYQTEDSFRSSAHLSEALNKWPGSENKSQTAYSLAHDTDLPMFEHMVEVGKIERFRKAMKGQANQPHLSIDHVFAGYDWDKIVHPMSDHDASRKPLIVDVGGGVGHIASAISNTFPSFDVRVQDYGVTESYSTDGIDFTQYNFFQPQPIKGADVYFMRQIFHDWSDEYAVHILRNQVAAMGPHSKLVIMDLVLQQPGDWTLSEERKSRYAHNALGPQEV